MTSCFTAGELRNGNARYQEEPGEELRTEIVVLVWWFDCQISSPLPSVTDQRQKIQHPTVDVLLI